MRPNKLWMYEGMFSVIGLGFDADASPAPKDFS
jgi:hypothetical protein